ncbi:MAG TPA: hypothetical protein DEG47_05870, partial [Cyanobacteria bacterium UBA11148]|nr:hypothetical protein [Cyanobacteria bacterium UBA11148]
MYQIRSKFQRMSSASAIAVLVFCSSAVATEDPAAVNVVQDSTNEKLTEKTNDVTESTTNLTDSTNSILDQINQYTNDSPAPNPLGQVTNVSQLRDVQPGDWAYQALRSLIERYGIIAGYPNGTFRGNQSITRYEFAAALFNVLEQIYLLIQREQD